MGRHKTNVLKTTIAAVMAAALGATLSACTSEPEPTPPSKTGSFAIVGDTTSVLSWDAIKAGAMKAGEDLGVSVVFTAADAKTDQLGLVHQTMMSKPTGIGVGVVAGSGSDVADVVGEAQTSGTPAVLYDSPAAGTSLTTVVSNDTWIGQTAAQQLSVLVNSGKVAVVGNASDGPAKARSDAFSAYLKANAPRVTMAGTAEGADRAAASKATADLLKKNPGLVAIFATDGNSTLGVADAVKSAGAKNVKVLGVDALPDEVKAVKNGTIAGAIAQNPFNIGYQLVTVLAHTADGTPSPQKTVYSQAVWYTAANMKDPAVSTVLNLQ